MKNEAIYKEGRAYPYHFFWSKLEQIEQIYRLRKGMLVVGTCGDEREVLWGVQELSVLKSGLEQIKQKYSPFIFRYGGVLNQVLQQYPQIIRWGYNLKTIHVGYELAMEELSISSQSGTDISPLRVNDIDTLLKLNEELFSIFRFSRQEAEHAVNSPDEHVFIMTVDKKLVGFVFARTSPHGFIRNLGVHPAVRRQGFGEKLMNHVLRVFQEQGITRCTLWIEHDNLAARKLYEKIGFKLDESEAEAVFFHEKRSL